VSRSRFSGLSLETRMIAASAALALLVAGVFVALILAISSLREANEEEADAKDVTAAALELENLVLGGETAVRSFVLTGRPVVLEPYYAAWRVLPRRLARFRQLTRSDRLQSRRAEELIREINFYRAEYADLAIIITQEGSFGAARSMTRTEGRRRIRTLGLMFDRFLDTEDARTAERAESAADSAQRAIAVGIAGLAGSAAFIVLFGILLARSIARPIRDAAEGATRFAEGDLSVRLEPGGPGEVGELTRAFNEMAERLARARVELETQNAQLRENERLKSELVNTVSHELRTPLASVLGFTTLLLQREFEPETRRHYLGIVDAQARRLSDLINDFLDVRRIEEGRFELAEEILDMAPLLREEALLYSAQSNKHRVDLDLPQEPLKVRGDPDRLRQVVGNLLSNAIKYSPQGGTVELAAERDGEAVRVHVRDHGIGIPEKQKPRIFTKFFRGDVAESGISGTGLGLAVARDIVESHGGRIGFTSSEGEGTTFWLELPEANGHERGASRGDRAEGS
jgi:signal transduction histidine kinase